MGTSVDREQSEIVNRGRPAARRRAWTWGRAVAAVALLALAGQVRPPSGAAAAAPVVIAPPAPVQGDTVAIVIHAAAGSSVAVRFNGASLPVFAVTEGTWRALRGTDPDTPPGTYPVAVVITPPGGSAVTARRTVRIGRTQFAERHLTLPPKTMGLVTPKNLAIEAAALNSVLGRRTPEAFWSGPFHAPVTGPVDSPYGDQGFYNGRREWWHQGVDFDVPAGVPVTAPSGALVALARALPLGGNTIVLDHGQGVLTEYLHLSSFAVHEGERVAPGDLIGRIGATGLVTGPSLHWGLYADGHWVNPLFWTTARPGLTD
ncbi:MAG TPA: M23 family metallopeptidase [bacterium]|nr:M23 family metallopeptidase [bacterium]